MFSLICGRINSWVNNGEAGELRRHRAHYDVIVMWWENPPMGLPMPARSHQSRSKRTSMLVPISPKRGIFSMGNADSQNQEKGAVFIINFGKLNSHSLITQHTFTSNQFLIQMFCTIHCCISVIQQQKWYWPYCTRVGTQWYILVMQSMDRGFESHQECAISHLIRFQLFQEQLFIIENGYCCPGMVDISCFNLYKLYIYFL